MLFVAEGNRLFRARLRGDMRRHAEFARLIVGKESAANHGEQGRRRQERHRAMHSSVQASSNVSSSGRMHEALRPVDDVCETDAVFGENHARRIASGSARY